MNSSYTIKRASFSKRIVAFLFDLMCAFFLFVAAENLIVHPIVNHTMHYNEIDAKYEEKLIEHGCAKLDEKGKFTFIYDDKGVVNLDKFYKDDEAVEIQTKKSQLDVFKLTLDLMLSSFVICCLVPLILKNGQTFGKKLMKLALVSTNEVKVRGWNVFARWAIGIFAFETILNFYFVSFFVIPLPLAISIILAMVTKKGMSLHDFIGGTIVVDLNNTIIISTVEERRKRILEEKEAYESHSQKKLISQEEIEKQRL